MNEETAHPLIKRKKHLFYAVAAWCVLLIILALEPAHVVEMFLPGKAMKSFGHSIFYGTLTYILCLYLRFKRTMFGVHLKEKFIWIWAVLMTSAMGALTELSQHFTPDRRMDFNDWIYDVVGAVVAVIVFNLTRNLL